MLLVVPLIERLGLVETFVALQTNQAGIGEFGDALGELGLAGSGRPLNQNGLAEALGEVYDAGDAIIGEVVDFLQAISDLRDGSEGSRHWGKATHRQGLRHGRAIALSTCQRRSRASVHLAMFRISIRW